MEIEIRVTEIIFSIICLWGKKFSTQGRITPKCIIRSGPDFELIRAFMSVLFTYKFDKYQRWLRKARDIILFTTHGHVTPNWLVRSSRNSHLSNISCLSLLPISLMKTEFIVTDNPSGTKFWCQQEHLVTSVICCEFKRNLFEVWFYTIFFHDFIHVYSPKAGPDSPKGTKF